MNSLKMSVIVLLLAVGAGGVYTLINGGRHAPPAGAMDPLPGPPNLQFGQDLPVALATPGSPPAVSFATDQPNSVPPSFSAPLPPAPSPPPSGAAPGESPSSLPPVAKAGNSGPSASTGVRPTFAEFMRVAVEKLNADGWVEVLDRLSQWYGDPRLTADESRQMANLLDQVAGSVIYSTRSILEPPYRVQAGDTLESIARIYDVPGELLAKINGLRGPEDLAPGREIKVVHGPFDAEVQLAKFELVLKLQGRYAGRFPIGLGRNTGQLEGSYAVREKSIMPACRGPEGPTGAESPSSPSSERMIILGDRVAIRGADDPRDVDGAGAPGGICLAARDIEEVYDILSIGSKVVIRR